MLTIALMGAGGKAGYRVASNLKNNSNYKTYYVEISDSGHERLAKLGVPVTPEDKALPYADAVILAVPDIRVGAICQALIPKLKSGTMVISLDPAAAYAGVLPERPDITYFVTHPCHPSVFHDETDPEARMDWFGGVKAKQSIVCALHRGPESDYARCEEIARAIWAPVTKSYRITVEQMAILEPGLTETLATTTLAILREGLDEAIRMGVPKEAALDFFFGHIRTGLAISFGVADFPISAGAKLAVERAKPRIFRRDWKKVMSIASIKRSVREITGALK